MLKGIRVSALFVLCLSLAAFAPVYAGQGAEKAPSFNVSVGAPVVRSITDQDLQDLVVDISKLPVRLDGRLLPEGSEAKRARQELYLAVDQEEGVINAFRTYEELDAHVKANPALDCNTQNKINESCVFWNVPNCTPVAGARAVVVACGTLAANITSPAGLNGPIQSFNLGCNNTILIPNGNCTTPPNGAALTGVPGTCVNVTNSPFNCAGCGPRQ